MLALAAALVAGSAASPAFAHDELVGSDPAVGSEVAEMPTEVTLTFSGVLLTGEGTTDVVVTDAAGTALTSEPPVVDGVRVIQPISGSASGEITVTWRVVSSDGHPISDQFSFVVAGAGTGSTTAPSGAASPSPSAQSAEAGSDGTELLPVWITVGVVAVVAVVFVVLLTRRRGLRED
ncbi:copper resistance CopC family protein [Microbacterium sp. TNHR37B]|uniref:copper resistance CopC family protein n=1 Tax=Microbacterium sp. TNHR37B TaxID=1775956 RepID=UPI0007B1B6F8|nr:copper resistance CopC family protein [Microbacterium sp. TNHR37B]KZE90656.1 Copper resistance protein C [Microbacterium sp. TNHR37B]